MSNKNKGQNFLLQIDKHKFQESTKGLENAAKSETTSVSTETPVQNTTSEKPAVEQKTVEKKQTKKAEPASEKKENEHPILSGESKYTVRLYDNLHDLLKLYKATRSGADLMETVNRLVYEGLKKDGTLKELQALQSSFKK